MMKDGEKEKTRLPPGEEKEFFLTNISWEGNLGCPCAEMESYSNMDRLIKICGKRRELQNL